MHHAEESNGREFAKLLKFTLTGYVVGLLVAAGWDAWGDQRSPWGQALVRTFAGEGESIAEGMFALRQRWQKAAGSLAEAYGWGMLLALCAPWFIDATTRLSGLDAYGPETFFVPYFYAMSDQIGANLSGLIFLRSQHAGWSRTWHSYLRQPSMVAGLAIILLVPMGLFAARLLGFSPSTQLSTVAEAIIANVCWLPPLMGWLSERRS